MKTKTRTSLWFLFFACISNVTGQIFIDPGNYNVQVQTYEYRQFSTCNGFGARANSMTYIVAEDTDGVATILGEEDICVRWDDQALSPAIHREALSAFIAYGVNTSNLDFNSTMWNDDQECFFGNDRCSPNQTIICNDCDGVTTNTLIPIREGVSAKWNFQDLEDQGDLIRFRKIWRPSKGDTYEDPIPFGTVTTNDFLRHANSNRQTPTDAQPNMGYSDFYDSVNHPFFNASMDVFYSFSINANSRVTISTDWSNTNFLTKLVLLQTHSSGIAPLTTVSAANLQDNAAIQAALSPGTYVIQVEGVSNFEQGDFTLSIVVSDLQPSSGSIEYASETEACPGQLIPDINSLTPAGYGQFDYSNVSATNLTPLYSWWIAIDGSQNYIQMSGLESSDIPIGVPIEYDFTTINIHRRAQFGSSIVISNSLTFSRCSEFASNYCSTAAIAPNLPTTSSFDFTDFGAIVGGRNSTVPVPAMCGTGPNEGCDIWVIGTLPYTGRLNVRLVTGGKLAMSVYFNGCDNLIPLACQTATEVDYANQISIIIEGDLYGIIPGQELQIRIWEYDTGKYGDQFFFGTKVLPCADTEIFNDNLGSGNWNSPTRWFQSGVPQACDNVNIINGQVTVDGQAECLLLEVGSGNGLTVPSGVTLEVHGQ